MTDKKTSKTTPLDLQPNGGYAILGSWANAYLAKPSKTLATGREKQMASQIETFADGSASFFSNRVPAWHALGTVTENALSAGEALETAHLNWEVLQYPVQADVSGTPVIADGKRANVRTHPKTGEASVLGIVGTRYTIVQNEQAFKFCDDILDIGGASFETAGSLDKGRKVFMTMKMPEGINVGGHDAVNMYLMVVNSHDGSTPLIAAVTPVRVVCANTVAAGVAAAKSVYRVAHTSSATGRISDAREALKMSYQYTGEFELLANELYQKSMSDSEFIKFAEKLMGDAPIVKEGESTRSLSMFEAKRDSLMGLWKAPTQDNIKNTAWAAYNTVVEYVDWFSPVRGGNVEARRGERIVENTSNDFKEKALALLK
jgi:phage/plasmid-like protein (TIGR03299 family)